MAKIINPIYQRTKISFKEFLEENQTLYTEIAMVHNLHPDDDFQSIEQIAYLKYYVPEYGEDIEFDI